MRKLIFLILLLLNSFMYGQITFENNNFEVKKLYKDNIVNIKNDTAYIMNSKTFKIYNNCFNKSKENNCYNLLIQTQSLYEDRIIEMNSEYNLLNEQYKILMNESNNLVSDNLKQIEKIDTTLLSLDKNFRETLKTINKKSRTNYIIYSGLSLVGGIIIGLLL